MKFEKERNSLFVFPEGNINSNTVAQVESEIFGIAEKQTFKKLILDFSNVNYISSAGLRMVLKLKQQFDDVSIFVEKRFKSFIVECVFHLFIGDRFSILNAISNFFH